MRIKGNLEVRQADGRDFSALTSVRGSLFINSDATLDAPALTSVRGLLYIDPGAMINAPLLTAATSPPQTASKGRVVSAVAPSAPSHSAHANCSYAGTCIEPWQDDPSVQRCM